MPEFAPVRHFAELDALDEAEVRAGYLAGLHGLPEPLGSQYSRSYWHGWRNGAVDAGHREQDAAQAMLAHEFALAQGVTAYSAPVSVPEGWVPVQ